MASPTLANAEALSGCGDRIEEIQGTPLEDKQDGITPPLLPEGSKEEDITAETEEDGMSPPLATEGLKEEDITQETDEDGISLHLYTEGLKEDITAETEEDGISPHLSTEGLKKEDITAESDEDGINPPTAETDEDGHSTLSGQSSRQGKVGPRHTSANIPDAAVNLVKQKSGLDAEAARKAGLVLIQFMKEKRHTEGVQNLLKYISGVALHSNCAGMTDKRIDSSCAKIVSTPVHVRARRPEFVWPLPGRMNGLEESVSEDELDGISPPVPTKGLPEEDIMAETDEDRHSGVSGQTGQSSRQVEVHSCHICVNIPGEAVNLVKQSSGLDSKAARKAAFVLIQFMKEKRHTEGVQNLLKYISDLAFHCSSANKRIDSNYAKMVSTSVPFRVRRPEIGWPGGMNEQEERLFDHEQDSIYPPVSTKGLKEEDLKAETDEDGHSGLCGQSSQVETHSCHICANIPDEAVNLVKRTSGLETGAARKAAFVVVQFMKENRHTEEVQNLLKYISDLAFHGSSVNKRIDSQYTKMVSTPVHVCAERAEIGWPGRTRNGLKESMSEDEQDGIYPTLPTKDFEDVEEACLTTAGEDVTGHSKARRQRVPEQTGCPIKEQYVDSFEVSSEDSEDSETCQLITSLRMNVDFPLKSRKYMQTEPVIIMRTKVKQRSSQPEREMTKKGVPKSGSHRTSHDGPRLTSNESSRIRSDPHRENWNDGNRHDSRNVQQAAHRKRAVLDGSAITK